NGHDQQQAKSAKRRFKRLRRSLKASADGLRKELCGFAVHSSQSVAQRDTRSQVKADSHCWKLAKVGDAQRTYFALENRYRTQRNKLAGFRVDVKHPQS